MQFPLAKYLTCFVRLRKTVDNTSSSFAQSPLKQNGGCQIETVSPLRFSAMDGRNRVSFHDYSCSPEGFAGAISGTLLTAVG